MRNLLGRPRVLIGALVATGALAAAPAAMATSGGPFTWTGGPNSGSWSDPTNWSGGNVPVASDSDGFTFGACTPSPSCDASVDDFLSVTATSLTIADNQPYSFAINGGSNVLTLGTGAAGTPPTTLTAQPIGNATDLPEFGIPVSLAGSQNWLIDGSGDNNGPTEGLGFQDPITDSNAITDTLGVTLSGAAFVGLNGANDVGAVTFSGNSANTGPGSSENGTVALDGSLNAGVGGQPVTFDDTELFTEPVPIETGPLSVNGGWVSLSADPTDATTVQVDGAFSLDSQSALDMTINGAGTVAGTDFNQIAATGNVQLGGDLELFGPSADCVNVPAGSTPDTLIRTSGALTGTFTDLPDGSMTSFIDQCSTGVDTVVPVRINYTSNSVIATVMTASTTTLQAQDSNNIPSTNQAATLVATVTQATGTPDGTVAFSTDDGTIPGCGTVPVATGGTATCTTSGLGALGSSYDVTAAYAPSSILVEPTQDDESFDVFADPTTTNISASSMSPRVGDAVTYTAAVMPADTGAFVPSGELLFFAQGQDGNDTQLCPDAPGTIAAGGTATCTTTYGGAGSPAVYALYTGDGNFDFSESSPLTVTVSAPAPAPMPAPTPTPTPPPPAAGTGTGTGVSTAQTPIAKDGAVNVQLSCAAGGATCTVTTTITVVETLHRHSKVVHRTVVVGTEKTTVAPGATKRVHVTLSSAGRKLLAKHKSLKTTVKVTSGTGKATKTVAAKKVTLIASKHHKK